MERRGKVGVGAGAGEICCSEVDAGCCSSGFNDGGRVCCGGN